MIILGGCRKHFIYTILLPATPYSLEVVLPLSLIYKEKIFRVIVESLLEKGKLNYSKLYAAVTDNTHSKLSHRDFNACLKQMISENILHKEDSTRGKSVIYSLTEKALRQNTLRILGIDAKVERRKHLYRQLLFYEAYKRRPLLTEKQLHIFLKKIGCATSNLEQIGKWRSPFDKTFVAVFKPIKGIEIIRFGGSKIKSGSYYIVTPGFSAEELIKYLRMLKRGKDPRPFRTSSPFPGVYVPLVYFTWTEDEVVDAIESLCQEGLIKQIMPVFHGETRFQIVDDSLLRLICSVWMIHIVDFHLCFGRLVYGEKTTPEDKKYLSQLIGEKGANKMFALTYHFRHPKKRESDKNEIEKNELLMQELNEYRKSRVQEIIQIYEKVIRENEVIAKVLQEICLSPLI